MSDETSNENEVQQRGLGKHPLSVNEQINKIVTEEISLPGTSTKRRGKHCAELVEASFYVGNSGNPRHRAAP